MTQINADFYIIDLSARIRVIRVICVLLSINDKEKVALLTRTFGVRRKNIRMLKKEYTRKRKKSFDSSLYYYKE